ncbi:MAG TPA: GNAT family N-acetyltransferase [Stellaceae bacterium]|nr:GNAT family N-acetyltransferase [Stellaceae bacterium]
MAEPVEIRPAVRAEVPAIVTLLADDTIGAGREQNTDPLPDTYFEAFDDIAAQPGNFLLIAETGGAIVGCLQLTIIPGLSRTGTKRGQIEGVRVAGPWRRGGIGEQLVRHAIGLAREAGCGLVQLTSDNARADARRFYERLGFVASHVGMKFSLD